MQFIEVEFHEGGRRYAYANPLEPVEIGARVLVDVRGARKAVTVVEVLRQEPPFPCKAILGALEETDANGGADGTP